MLYADLRGHHGKRWNYELWIGIWVVKTKGDNYADGKRYLWF